MNHLRRIPIRAVVIITMTLCGCAITGQDDGSAPDTSKDPEAMRLQSGGLLTAVSDFDTGRYALGYNVFYYVTEMKKDPNVKILAVDGVMPEKETIQQGTYPLVHDFYVVTRKDEAPDSPANQVAEWLQGEEGQMLIDLEGYVAK